MEILRDPVAGLREMARVTRPDGLVVACVWDFAGERAPISAFWQAAREADADVDDESDLAGAREGHLSELFQTAGLRGVEEAALLVSVEHETFDDWWEPFELSEMGAGGPDPQLEEIGRASCRARVL